MSSILSRYIFKEAAQTWLAVTLVLLLILLTDQFARVLGDAAAAKLPKEAIFFVLGLSSVQYLTILVPVGLFLSIMLALARLYRDSEMAAMMACGIGIKVLYRPLMFLAMFLASLVALLSLQIAPSAIRTVEVISDRARQEATLGILEPGRFISFGGIGAVMYAESVSADGRLENVFVQRRRDELVEVIMAEAADQTTDEESGLRVLTFYNGKRYEGVPGEYEFRLMQFAEHGIPFELPDADASDLEHESWSTAELWGSDDPFAVAELQWRLSVPLTLLVLAFLAVPMSKSAPRQGRYSNLAAGLLLYIMYINLLGASKVWIEQDEVPAVVGMWWVHLLFIVFGTILLLRQSGFFARLFSGGGQVSEA
ncbi:MAG: LPS export ABC transporter permease LptF [Gammaproteobacteria bacterium]